MNQASESHVTAEAGTPERRPKTALQQTAIVATAWTLGFGTVAAVRLRSEWDAYVAMHRWCAANGVPDWVRNFDSLIILGAAAFIGAGLAACWGGGSPAAQLGLRRGRSGWRWMTLFALLPMVAGGLVLGCMRWAPEVALPELLPKFIGGVVRAPIAEELLFRGLLVGVCAAAIGWRGIGFWTSAIAAAMLFAITHVPWTVEGIAKGWPTLLMTGAGGLWYTWLFARWGSLWVPMTLHAGMNLGWLLAGASGGAGGGGWIENLLRVATIAIATWWSVRRATGQPEP